MYVNWCGGHIIAGLIFAVEWAFSEKIVPTNNFYKHYVCEQRCVSLVEKKKQILSSFNYFLISASC